jgi:peptide/nickel transport system substrate-binding protein
VVQRSVLYFFLLGLGIPTYDSESTFHFLYHTRGQTAGTWNGTRFGNPEMDRRIIALASTADQNARNREMAALWAIVQEETVYVPLHVQSISHAMRGGIDVPVHPDAGAWFKFFKFSGS